MFIHEHLNYELRTLKTLTVKFWCQVMWSSAAWTSWSHPIKTKLRCIHPIMWMHSKSKFCDEVKSIYMCLNAGRTSEMKFWDSELVMRDLREECLFIDDNTFNGAPPCQEALKALAYNGNTNDCFTRESGFGRFHNVATTIAPTARANSTSTHQHREGGPHLLRLLSARESCKRRSLSIRTMMKSVAGRG